MHQVVREPEMTRLLVEAGNAPSQGPEEVCRANLADLRIRIYRLVTGDHLLVRHVCRSGAGAPSW